MIMLHDSAHERLLERLAAGDPVAQDELELVRACPDCARIEGELGAIQARLESVGQRRRDVVRSALATPAPADARERIEHIVRRPRDRVLRLGLLAAALAAGLALWLWIGGGGSQDPGVGFMLGTSGIEAVSPISVVESFAPFRFRVDERPAGWYTVEIYGPEGPLGDPLVTSTDLDAGPELHEWNPAEAQAAALPDTIRWRVLWHPGDGPGPESSAWFSASRSPR